MIAVGLGTGILNVELLSNAVTSIWKQRRANKFNYQQGLNWGRDRDWDWAWDRDGIAQKSFDH